MRIIVDAMGGDNAPLAQIEGSLIAAKEFGCDITFVGDRAKLMPILSERIKAEEIKEIDGTESCDAKYQLLHTESVISTDEEAIAVVKSKRDCSMAKAFDLLKASKGDALVSSGNTAALLTGAQLITKRIKGIRRAALAPIIPTVKGGALLIDCGANAECTGEYLLQFALMGSKYCSSALGVKNPKVGLLNNGAEAHKGDSAHLEAYKLIKAASDEGKLNFAGNIEARYVTDGDCDVIVSDGFSGNVLVKGMEGMALYISGLIKNMFYKNPLTIFAGLLVKSGIKKLRASLDYKEVGGAPLIGVNVPVIKSHGSANAYAFRSAIKQAIAYTESGFIKKLTDEIAKE